MTICQILTLTILIFLLILIYQLIRFTVCHIYFVLIFWYRVIINEFDIALH